LEAGLSYSPAKAGLTKETKVTHIAWVRGASRKDKMEQQVIKATKRDVIGKQVKALRREGKLPAIMYGGGQNPQPLLLDLREASHSISHMAASSLLTLDVEGDKHLAVVREKQRDFIRGTLKHIDFQVVSMNEKLRLHVSITVKGESLAIKDFNGVLVSGLEEVEVECFPQDLPEKIVVDISSIQKIGDGIYVRDLVPPPNVVILEDKDEMVVLVTGQAAEEVVEVAPVEEIVSAEPEVIEKGKKEEEEIE